ncbi:3-hydroxyacyl-ACP dehydratase FabZ [Xanthomonas sp. MUS 060]|uniref:3-hydroxyacyl-ACP dehydratase FabZ n=1 Tax=Xanthomonas sp. MUS 060 TaxID=1588031 RepID=UPI0005F2C33D|nr:3-hydroxyacyl-ACP dehydratase FabZ [Xanthomonas sp. MUS 060]
MSHDHTLPSINRIMALMPHRYPFLMVDKVISLDFENRKIVAHKNVTINEPFFQGHFPNLPIMPGVLIIEAIAQVGGLLIQLAEGPGVETKPFFMVKVNNVRFNSPVVPGDVLELHVEIKRVIRNMAVYCGEAKVNGEVVAYAEVMCAKER